MDEEDESVDCFLVFLYAGFHFEVPSFFLLFKAFLSFEIGFLCSFLL